MVMPSGEQVNSDSDLIRVTRAAGTIRLAEEFLDAASHQDLRSVAPSLVGYFLLGHSIELALKAGLITRGITDRGLRRLGHSISACLTETLQSLPLGTLQLK
jgi:hypothetical protein